MSHFAKINSSNVVTEVIVAEKDFINLGVVGDEFLWVQTSYNGNFRGRFAKVGDTWDNLNNRFIPNKPFPSWILNETSLEWQAPVENTESPNDKLMEWNEDTLAWVEVDGS